MWLLLRLLLEGVCMAIKVNKIILKPFSIGLIIRKIINQI